MNGGGVFACVGACGGSLSETEGYTYCDSGAWKSGDGSLCDNDDTHGAIGSWDVSRVQNMRYSEWCPPSCLSSSLLPTLSMSLTLSLSLHFSQCLKRHPSLINPWETGMY